MIVDSSALMAILFKEPEAPEILRAFAAARRCRMAAPNWLEICMVFDRRASAAAKSELDQVRERLGVAVVAFDQSMAELARVAFATYGKGSKHPAKLNFGDCMAYALAKQTGEPLLFKGGDFTHTDIAPALN